MTKKTNQNLTDVEFWTNYWHNLALPSTVDQNFSFDRCLSRALLKNVTRLASNDGVPGSEYVSRKSILEVGAAPGKWLSIFPPDTFCVSGIEYSEAGMMALRKNLEMLSIQPKELIHGDFFAIEPSPAYDIVMSLGFIEHFDNPVEVVDRHLKWLLPGGVLIIGVPNFSGIHGFVQKHLDLGVLQAHNTSIMNEKWFENLGETLRLQTHSIEYLGSFEPDLPLTYKALSVRSFAPKALLRLARYVRRARFFDDLNGPRISSYILAVYKKSE
ncbi:MAG: class I SAM-dependent methyltransferase [Rhodocyclaceae bacterium]|nr:class I SAM-dependent methyltransferase [Rhodocyclaceae bacterium]